MIKYVKIRKEQIQLKLTCLKTIAFNGNKRLDIEIFKYLNIKYLNI